MRGYKARLLSYFLRNFLHGRSLCASRIPASFLLLFLYVVDWGWFAIAAGVPGQATLIRMTGPTLKGFEEKANERLA